MNTNILKKALISEKSFAEASSNSKCTFIVSKKASKEEIAFTCKELFGVEVLDVNTANFKGKVKKGKKGNGTRSDFKKAVVTLKKGQKIDLFEIEEEKKEVKKAEKNSPAGGDKKVEPTGDTKVTVKEKKK